MKKHGFIFLFMLCFFAAQSNIDSVKLVFRKAKKDTSLANDLFSSAKTLRFNGEYSSALELLRENKKWVFNLKSIKHTGFWYNAFGLVYDYQGYIDSALIYYNKALVLMQKAGDKYNESKMYQNIGIAYIYQGDSKQSIENFLKGLKIADKYKYTQVSNTILQNIGGVYFNIADYKKAEHYFWKRINAGDDGTFGGVATSWYNLGMIAFKEFKNDSGVVYLNNALELFSKEDDHIGMADSKAALGAIYRQKGDYVKAKLYYEEAMAIMHQYNQVVSPEIYMNAAILYGFINEKQKAYAFIDTALTLISRFKSRQKYSAGLKIRAQVRYQFKEYKLAYDDLWSHITINDSVFSDQNVKAIQDLKVDYDKKKDADSIKLSEKHKREKEKAILEAEAQSQDKRNKTIIYGVIAFSVLIIAFALIVFRRFQITKKQNKIIELQKKEVVHQKEIVEEKNKEIVDSINYAKRLQEAILPSEIHWKNALPDSFILYMPKDIVAGDFYWLDVVKNNILFAAADCTGHGVPGALVSVVCSNALNRTVNEFGRTKPSEILDKTTELVIETFIKSGTDVKDGMDISLCNLLVSEMKLQWCGANNPLWILRNGEILEWKADKQPVGMYFDTKPFTNHEIKLEKGDIIYVFSDGYADQFGGEKKKKFKESSLKKLILSVKDDSMKIQQEKIKSEFMIWKGNLEQIDDVCVIGVKL
jgi:serine phosphatase RsbU (regulator of sigma subunit)/Tfp pilus assembly protein PilF